jgi:nicotinate phosphoribosyltransferase
VATALMTDKYELTMVQAALLSGKAATGCVFEAFARQLPAGRRFGVVAGTGRLLRALENLRFESADLEFLKANNVVDENTLNFLADFRFRGDVFGYAEGELYFGQSPILRVECSFAEGVLIETLLLSIMNYDSAIASAAARMRIAAQGRYLAEMGARRANESAAVAAARAAYIAGFDATSNLEAHRSYGVPSMGTSAHAFTLLYETEQAAFEAQLASMGVGTTLLVDTYDIETAVKSAVKLTDGKIAAVRLDSGDLASTAIRVRNLLDELGAHQTKIVVTNDLDEYTIAALQAAPVDRYGVGTALVTGSGEPTAGFVYKLVSHESSGDWVDVEKKSVGKASRGGKKHASRLLTAGVAQAEQVGEKQSGRELQVKLMAKGQILEPGTDQELTERARAQHSRSIAELSGAGLRLSKGEPAIPTLLS